MFLFALLFLLAPALALNVTVCDCGSAESKGFLKFSDEDCDHLQSPTPPVQVHYSVFSTLDPVTRFPGHTCSMWVMTKSVYQNFLGWETVSDTRLPLEVSAAECRKMRDKRLCDGFSMDVLGNNKWALERPPHVQSSWLRTTTISITNCHLEEVVLETVGVNNTISSPIGDIPAGTNGSMSHNLVTLVWENAALKETRECKVRELDDSRTGWLHNTSNPSVQRIRDPIKQLDYLFNTTSAAICELPARSSLFKPVVGMENVYIKIHFRFPLKAKPTNHSVTIINSTTTLIRSEIETAAHTQYIRDIAVDMANGLSHELRVIQCQTRELAHRNAIATAQYNGWLAAGYLDLPQCSKLVTVGESVSVLQCVPKNVTFTTEFTSCGPQPKFENSTINIEGWELTSFSECYWPANFVNFNGHAHSYRNGTWAPIVPSIVSQGHKLIDTLPIEADNSLGTLLKLHPALRNNPMSPAVAVAEILASVHAHHAANPTGVRHVSTVLLNPNDAPHIPFLTRIGIWFRNFGILSGVGITGLLAFRFCGIGSMLIKFIPCLSIFSPYSCLNRNSSNNNSNESPAVTEPIRQTVHAMPAQRVDYIHHIEMQPMPVQQTYTAPRFSAAANTPGSSNLPIFKIETEEDRRREAARLFK